MNHEEKVEAALEAVRAVFSDTDVPQTTTRESLEELQGEIETMLDTLADS
jgi:hypothetical protein